MATPLLASTPRAFKIIAGPTGPVNGLVVFVLVALLGLASDRGCPIERGVLR